MTREDGRNQSGLEGYTRIHGDGIQGPTRKMLAHIHGIGPGDDGLNGARRIVEFAAANEFDLILTPHNSLQGYEKALRFRDNNGYGMVDMVAGQEYAARDSETGQDRHMLVLGIDTEVPPGMSEDEANRFTHRRGGITAAAHPGLGTYSTTIERITELSLHPDPEVGYDLVEGYNDSVRQAEAYTRKLGELPPVFGCIGERVGLPQVGLNARAAAFMDKRGDELRLKRIAGTDSHSLKQMDAVVIVRPADISPLDALGQGRVDIYVRDDPKPVTIVQFAGIRVSNFAGKLMKGVPVINTLYHRIR